MDKHRPKEAIRFSLLKAMYRLADSSPTKYIDPNVLSQAANISDVDEFTTGVRYLHDEGLLSVETWRMGVPGLLRITHAGVVEYEAAINAPNEPTQHFRPLNVLYVGTMIGSAIQQGTSQSSQSVSASLGSIEELTKFVAAFEALLPQIGLDADSEKEARAELDSISAQANSPRPKRAVIGACLESLRHVLEHAGGAAIGHHLALHAPTVVTQLEKLITVFR